MWGRLNSLRTYLHSWKLVLPQHSRPPLLIAPRLALCSNKLARPVLLLYGPVTANERVSSWKIPDAQLHTTEIETETCT